MVQKLTEEQKRLRRKKRIQIRKKRNQAQQKKLKETKQQRTQVPRPREEQKELRTKKIRKEVRAKSQKGKGVIWKVPRLWPDSTIYILGGGPSLADTNFDLIKNEYVIGVNNAYTLGDWVDVCWFGDSRWQQWHDKQLKKFSGLKCHCASRIKEHDESYKRLARGKPQGIDKRPTYVSWNRSSGASAINLAYHLGANRIVLLGFDMHKAKIDGEQRANWHKDHPTMAKSNPYPRFLSPFKMIKHDAKEFGIEILNATPGSSLKEFPMVELEALFL